MFIPPASGAEPAPPVAQGVGRRWFAVEAATTPQAYRIAITMANAILARD